MRTNEIAKRTALEASNSCQPNGYMSLVTDVANVATLSNQGNVISVMRLQ